jgi:hypothetical protein
MTSITTKAPIALRKDGASKSRLDAGARASGVAFFIEASFRAAAAYPFDIGLAPAACDRELRGRHPYARFTKPSFHERHRFGAMLVRFEGAFHSAALAGVDKANGITTDKSVLLWRDFTGDEVRNCSSAQIFIQAYGRIRRVSIGCRNRYAS